MTLFPYMAPNFFLHSGVKSVDCDMEAQVVTVDADDSVAPETMLESLQKVRAEIHASAMMVNESHLIVLCHVFDITVEQN